jgi:hypothetical protein
MCENSANLVTLSATLQKWLWAATEQTRVCNRAGRSAAPLDAIAFCSVENISPPSIVLSKIFTSPFFCSASKFGFQTFQNLTATNGYETLQRRRFLKNWVEAQLQVRAKLGRSDIKYFFTSSADELALVGVRSNLPQTHCFKYWAQLPIYNTGCRARLSDNWGGFLENGVEA